MASGMRASPRAWVLAGLLTSGFVALADLFVSQQAVLIALLFAGPLLAAIGATARQTALVGLYALVLAVALGRADGIFLETDHWVRITAVLIGSVAAVVSADIRDRRDKELRSTRRDAYDARRFALALDAAAMGTWSWTIATGEVYWDERLEALYGLAPGAFDRKYATYIALIHPDDRARVAAAVEHGMTHDGGWRFEHRVVWHDGSEHWLEGRGEPVRGASGAVVGAAGVSIGIDARRAADDDRAALLDAERVARETAERSRAAIEDLASMTMALSGATTVDDVGEVIVSRGIPVLGAATGYFATVDPKSDELVLRIAQGYSDAVIQRYASVPLAQVTPATDAVRNGMPILVESPADRRARYPEYADEESHGAFIVVPVSVAQDVRAALAFGFDEARAFTDDDRRYIAAVIEACAQALQRASLFEAEQTSRQRLRTLLDASEALAALDDPDEVTATVARIAAERVGRYATVQLLQPDGSVRQAAIAHADPAREADFRRLLAASGTRGGMARVTQLVAETGEAMVFRALRQEPDTDPDLAQAVARLNQQSAVVVPLGISNRVFGVLAIGDDRPDSARAPDVELALDLGRRAASALERVQLHEAEQLRAEEALRESEQRFEAEHRVVAALQQTIVPEALPQVPGVELSAAYRPADVEVDVGGDWYDAFVLEDGRLFLVVGDVAGHGVAAASLMGRVRNALRAYAVSDPDPASVLWRTDRLLHTLDSSSMVTAFVACFDPATGELEWARAGHPPVLAMTETSHRFLDDVNGTPLGTLSLGFETARTRLEPGTVFVCYTDGLVERRDQVLDAGLAWLAERVREQYQDGLDDMCQSLIETPFVPHPFPDDICVLVLRINEVVTTE